MQNLVIDECWKKYFGEGWTPIDMPSKQECFEAGFRAGFDQANKLFIAIKHSASNKLELVKGEENEPK